MKTLILILSLFLSASISAQEFPSEPDSLEQVQQEEAAYKEYLSYKPCMTCGEQWKNGGSSQPTHSSSQRRILEENNLASQSVNSGRRFVQGLVAVIVAGTLATITYSLLTKSNNSVNEAFR